MENNKVIRYPITVDEETVEAFRSYCLGKGYRIGAAMGAALRLFVAENRSIDHGQKVSKK